MSRGPIYERVTWLALAIYLVGRLVDLVWHAGHEHFETASDQIQAHAVVWLGELLLLGGAVAALRARDSRAAYQVIAAAAALAVATSAWHFWEHFRLRDPDLPHILLLVSVIGILAGGAWLAAGRWRERERVRDRRPARER